MLGRIIKMREQRINNIKYGGSEGEENPFLHLMPVSEGGTRAD